MTTDYGESVLNNLIRAFGRKKKDVLSNANSSDWQYTYTTDPTNKNWDTQHQTYSIETIDIDSSKTGVLMPIVEGPLGVLHYKDGKLYLTDWDKSGLNKGVTTSKEISSIEDLLKIAIKKGLRG